MDEIVRLVYLSKALVPFSNEQLDALAQNSASRNATCNVTGMLLYSAGYFLQCLEGKSVTVSRIFERISADPRHHEVRKFLPESAAKRLFPSWNMGVLNLDQEGSESDRAQIAEIVAGMKQTTALRGPNEVLKLFKEFSRLHRRKPG